MFVGLLRGLAEQERMIPHDWDLLARTSLDSSEFLQFKTWWYEEAKTQALRNHHVNPPILITAEQLAGQRDWLQIERQAGYDDT